MQQVDAEEAKMRLLDLIDAALGGESVVIMTEAGKAVQLLPVAFGKGRPKFGSAKGLIKMSDDFDDPLPEFEEYSK